MRATSTASCVGDGFSPRKVEAFLTVLAQDARFRDIPVAVIGEALPDFADGAAQHRPRRRRSGAAGRAHGAAGAHACVRGAAEANAQIARRRRHVRSATPGCTAATPFGRNSARRRRKQASAAWRCRSRGYRLTARSIRAPARTPRRLLTRLIRSVDFACRDEDGALLIAFTQTDLRGAHVIARRIAGAVKNTLMAPTGAQAKATAAVTLATLKAGDTLDTPDVTRDGQPDGCRRMSGA